MSRVSYWVTKYIELPTVTARVVTGVMLNKLLYIGKKQI